MKAANEFLPIGFGVMHKQQALEMFSDELLSGYSQQGKIPEEYTHRYYWETKRRIAKNKPRHPSEYDDFIPNVIRGKHFNSWVEIAEKLGYGE